MNLKKILKEFFSKSEWKLKVIALVIAFICWYLAHPELKFFDKLIK